MPTPIPRIRPCAIPASLRVESTSNRSCRSATSGPSSARLGTFLKVSKVPARSVTTILALNVPMQTHDPAEVRIDRKEGWWAPAGRISGSRLLDEAPFQQLITHFGNQERTVSGLFCQIGPRDLAFVVNNIQKVQEPLLPRHVSHERNLLLFSLPRPSAEAGLFESLSRPAGSHPPPHRNLSRQRFNLKLHLYIKYKLRSIAILDTSLCFIYI